MNKNEYKNHLDNLRLNRKHVFVLVWVLCFVSFVWLYFGVMMAMSFIFETVFLLQYCRFELVIIFCRCRLSAPT